MLKATGGGGGFVKDGTYFDSEERWEAPASCVLAIELKTESCGM